MHRPTILHRCPKSCKIMLPRTRQNSAPLCQPPGVKIFKQSSPTGFGVKFLRRFCATLCFTTCWERCSTSQHISPCAAAATSPSTARWQCFPIASSTSLCPPKNCQAACLLCQILSKDNKKQAQQRPHCHGKHNWHLQVISSEPFCPRAPARREPQNSVHSKNAKCILAQ